jgi:hypothetical protein
MHSNTRVDAAAAKNDEEEEGTEEEVVLFATVVGVGEGGGFLLPSFEDCPRETGAAAPSNAEDEEEAGKKEDEGVCGDKTADKSRRGAGTRRAELEFDFNLVMDFDLDDGEDEDEKDGEDEEEKDEDLLDGINKAVEPTIEAVPCLLAVLLVG